MRNLLLAGMILLAVMTGCGEKTAPARKTYLYCRIDTLWQSLPSYQVTSDKLFPYGKLVDDRTYSDAAYRDGVAWIELQAMLDTTMPNFKCTRPRVVETQRRDNDVGGKS